MDENDGLSYSSAGASSEGSTVQESMTVCFEHNIIKAPELDFLPNSRGLGQHAFDSMISNKEKIAQISADTKAVDTFGDLLLRSIRTATEMRKRGITSADAVLTCTYNHMNSCVPYIAALFVGAKVVALDPVMSYGTTKLAMSNLRPKLVFTVSQCLVKYTAIVEELSLSCSIILFDSEKTCDSFKQFLTGKDNENNFKPFQVKDINDTAIIFFSSGTTGLPKGICISHYTVFAQMAIFTASGLPTEIQFSFTSLCWVSGVVLFMQSLWFGRIRVFCKSFAPGPAWRYIEKYKVTFFFTNTSCLVLMMKHGKPATLDTSSVRCVMIGGAPISKEHMLFAKMLFPDSVVCLLYNLTEVCGLCTMFKLTDPTDLMLLETKPFSCGRPIWGFWYKICDMGTHKTLGPNCIGELRLKTKFQLKGYYDTKSREGIWDKDGWLLTGDICFYDNDFCFYVVDRTKDMIRFQNFQIAPATIETILQTHPAVQAAAAFGIPNKKDGEHPMAAVLLASDVTTTAEDLITFVNKRVSDAEQLRDGLVFVESMPLTPSAKVRREVLKQQILSEWVDNEL